MKTGEKFDEFEELVLELDMARIIFAEEEEEEEEEARIVVSIKDITDRKRTEEALHRSEENFHRSLDDSPLGVRIVTIEGETIYVNRAILDIYGYDSIEELNTTPLKKRYTPESYAEFQIRWEKRIQGDDVPSKYEVSIVRKDGDVRQLQVSRNKVLWDGERQFQVVYQDITARKRAEEALRESEEKNRALFEDCPIESLVVTLEGRIMQYNNAFERSFEKRGRRLPEIGSRMYLDYASNHSIDMRTELIDCINSKTPKTFNEMLYKGRFLNISMAPTREGAIISAIDVTERKQAEEKILASLREKEILLREVHHRVKNNMQVISGLLDLQTSLSENPELIEKLNESQSRIRSMALIHEKLYGSEDFARIDLAGYVRTLSQDLFQLYKINIGEIALIIQTDGDIYVDIDKAIPCGLILNELISNTLKHAFPGDRQGELQIIIRETKNTEIEILLRDNGLGLPDDVDIHQPRSVGLHLVNGLVKNQLDGQIEVRRDNGTEFRIKFPLDLWEGR